MKNYVSSSKYSVTDNIGLKPFVRQQRDKGGGRAGERGLQWIGDHTSLVCVFQPSKPICLALESLKTNFWFNPYPTYFVISLVVAVYFPLYLLISLVVAVYLPPLPGVHAGVLLVLGAGDCCLHRGQNYTLHPGRGRAGRQAGRVSPGLAGVWEIRLD